MGGMNQNRYSAPAAAASHHAANSNHQAGMGLTSLPEYQYPTKRHQASSGSHPVAHQQHGTPSRQQQLRPRQHIVPAAFVPQQQQASLPLMDSPTLSQSSTPGASDNGSAVSQQQPCFHYNPYDTQCSRVSHQGSMEQQGQFPQAPHHAEAQYYEEMQQQHVVEEAPAQSALPYGTLHGHLEGYVSFVAYPTEEFVNPNKAVQVPAEGNMSRVFLGQLPYQVTDMQLEWLCFHFGAGGSVYFPERITKHDPMRGCKVPTGCIHAYADSATVTPMLNAMHKRILVDDTGVWYAETPEQQSILNDYCLMMKNDRTKRYQNRPYDTVVSQFATSSFVRRR